MKKFRYPLYTLVLLTAVACDKDSDKQYPNSLRSISHTMVMVDAEMNLSDNATYIWSMEESPSQEYTLANTTLKTASFVAAEAGEYMLQLTAKDKGEVYSKSVTVEISATTSKLSPYIAKVYDFVPSVGQFTNEMPTYNDGDTKADIILEVEKNIAGEKSSGMVSLGGFGGYVIFGFDHTVRNIVGKRDIRVIGNAFYLPGVESSGSCEPGVIMVSYDANKNGEADDQWYEIAGSEYYNETTIKDYEITYFRPDSESGDLTKYIRWEDNQGGSGFKSKNNHHSQSYFPSWISDDKITFKGTLLPNNGVNTSSDPLYELWVLSKYGFGYADNELNKADDSAFDISWAVDSKGAKVDLAGVDFVRIHTGVNQECGDIGEVSTEVSGAYDLHLKKEVVDSAR